MKGQMPPSEVMLGELLAPAQAEVNTGAGFTVAASVLWLVQAAVLAQALGELITQAKSATLIWAIAFVAIGLVRVALSFVADTKLQRAAETVVTVARRCMIAKEAQQAAESSFGGAGSVASLASEKLELLIPYVTRFAPAKLRVMVLPILILLACAWYSWIIALVLLVSGPLIPLFMALIGMAAKNASRQQLAEVGTLNELLVARLPGLLDIRLLGAGGEVEKRFLKHTQNLRKSTMAVLRVAFLSSAVLELFAALGVAMVAVLVGFSLLGTINIGNWGAAITPTTAIFLLLLAPDFFQPLRDFATAWHDRASASVVAEEFAHWADAEAIDLAGLGGTAMPLPGPATVKISGCRTPAGLLLPNISILAGTSVALVGSSGAGKTSALRLMAGLMVPASGKLKVAGVAFSSDIADAWRARIGWMPQSPHFLDASIASNVAMGRTGDVPEALKAAGIWDVVNALPDGVHTRLGETGGGLSGGEARRLTLARAIFAAPDIILADEPTADLDAETAKLVTDCLLRQAQRGATLVVATHDAELVARLGTIIRIGEAA